MGVQAQPAKGDQTTARAHCMPTQNGTAPNRLEIGAYLALGASSTAAVNPDILGDNGAFLRELESASCGHWASGRPRRNRTMIADLTWRRGRRGGVLKLELAAVGGGEDVQSPDVEFTEAESRWIGAQREARRG
nr:hypothetical protein CFP56_50933 [Quercus suber]